MKLSNQNKSLEGNSFLIGRKCIPYLVKTRSNMRLLSELYQVFTVTSDPIKIAKYRTYLFDDSEVPDVACTLKSTTHCSMGIASDIIGVLTNFFANKAYGADIREVPFLIEKSIDLFTYNVTI